MIPWYVRKRNVHRYEQQLELLFPEPHIVNFPRPAPPYLVELRQRQPRFFPSGWQLRALTDNDWRFAYLQEWIAKRKLAGLPTTITEKKWIEFLYARERGKLPWQKAA